MLTNLRNALMSGKRLPYDAEVEYLESTGSQYINTGLNSTVDKFCNFEIRFAKTTIGGNSATSRWNMPFGYRYGATARYGIWSASDNLAYVGVNNSHFVQTDKDTNWHTVKLENGVAVTIDGVATAVSSGGVRANIGLSLFGTVTNVGGAPTGLVVPSKIAYCKIWNTDGVLIRDYIPVRKGTVGAVYDRRGVGGMNPDGSPRNDGMYFNRGTGDFGYGNDLKYPIPAS